MNNPLSFTDPSGFSAWTRFRAPILAIAAALTMQYYLMPFLLGGTFGVACGANGLMILSSTGNAISAVASGFAAGGIAGGNIQSALQGALTAGLTFGVGEISGAHAAASAGNAMTVGERVAQVAGHAAVGCLSGAMAGGSCKAGAMAQGFSAFAGPTLPGGGTGQFNAGNMIGRMIIGAIASKLGGGKFENGALSAAFENLFNDLSVYVWNPRPADLSPGHVMVTADDGCVLQSQFPDPHGLSGKNITRSFDETIKAEGRPADAIYRVSLTPFQDQLASNYASWERGRDRWDVLTPGKEMTNCSVATDHILSPLVPAFKGLMSGVIAAPWTIGGALDVLSRQANSGIGKIR